MSILNLRSHLLLLPDLHQLPFRSNDIAAPAWASQARSESHNTRTMTLTTRLPTELVLRVFDFVDPPALVDLACTCKALEKCSRDILQHATKVSLWSAFIFPACLWWWWRKAKVAQPSSALKSVATRGSSSRLLYDSGLFPLLGSRLGSVSGSRWSVDHFTAHNWWRWRQADMHIGTYVQLSLLLHLDSLS